MNNKNTFNTHSNYHDEVYNFGGSKPDFSINNSNVDNINWNDITTDGKGNVINMPLLHSKLCFGRIEYLIRHGHKDQPLVKQGPKKAPKRIKCEKCPAFTKDSCKKLVAERMNADIEIKNAFIEWFKAGKKADNDPNPQKSTKKRYNRFYGPVFGELWDNCLKAVSNRGPFENSNDEAMRNEIDDKKERKRVRDAKKKRVKRNQERLKRKAERLEPPSQFIRVAWDECNKRSAQLMAAKKFAKANPRISRLTDEGCDFTALAWYYETLQDAMGERAKAGTMAKWLIQDTEYHRGKSYDTLKDRLRHDLIRARDIEAGKFGNIWQKFDPDADLDL